MPYTTHRIKSKSVADIGIDSVTGLFRKSAYIESNNNFDPHKVKKYLE